jgi:hypothetical protein
VTLSPRLLDLLARYPAELSDPELAELRAAAEADPRLEDALHELLELDAALDGLADGPLALSELGQRRLDRALRSTRAWGSGPAAPLEASAGDHVVSLFARRPVQLALAAALLAALGFAAARLFTPPAPNDPYHGGIKGDDDDSAAPRDRSLILQAPGEPRLEDGARRPIDSPLRITARLMRPMSLVLLEVQGDVSAVVWPLPGAAWFGAAGPNLLQPADASPDYRPAAPGLATYVLVARPTPLALPDRRVREADLLAANPGAVVLDRRSVLWTPPESP